MIKKHLNLFIIILLWSFLVTAGCSSPSGKNVPAGTKSSQPLLLGAYYYLWYPENWRDGYINDELEPPQQPALGRYDSTDLKTVEQQIAWSSQYGLNFWAVSWWPDHPELDRKLQKGLLRAKNISDLKFCIFYETAGLGLVDERITFTPEKTHKMVSDFKYLAKNYFSHPSYLRVKGRPVVIIYLTRTFSGDYPEAIRLIKTSLKEMGYDPYLIGDEIFWYVIRSAPLGPSKSPYLDRIKWFDAVTAYNMYDWARPKQMGYGSSSTFLKDIQTLYQEYRSAMGRDIKLVPAIIPGYNDRGVRLSEKHPVIPRQFSEGAEEGSFFVQALNQTVLPFIDVERPMALITTFNEWNEGTQIEPTVETAVTRKDRTPSGSDYTQGYAYRGYGLKYLTILQDTFAAVHGRVLDENTRNPLPKVEVKAIKGKEVLAVSSSDNRGFYNLSRLNLPPGNYEIQADMSGYGPIQTRITVAEEKSIALDLNMKKLHR